MLSVRTRYDIRFVNPKPTCCLRFEKGIDMSFNWENGRADEKDEFKSANNKMNETRTTIKRKIDENLRLLQHFLCGTCAERGGAHTPSWITAWRLALALHVFFQQRKVNWVLEKRKVNWVLRVICECILQFPLIVRLFVGRFAILPIILHCSRRFEFSSSSFRKFRFL